MANFAIFTRNYETHINAAGGRGVFRSGSLWATPERALKKGDTIDVYISLIDPPVEEEGLIKFRAKLASIILNPDPNDPDVIEMLKKIPSSTEGEELWEGNVKTLYELINIEKFEEKRYFIELHKLNGGKKIDPNYSRSYCIVQTID